MNYIVAGDDEDNQKDSDSENTQGKEKTIWSFYKRVDTYRAEDAEDEDDENDAEDHVLDLIVDHVINKRQRHSMWNRANNFNGSDGTVTNPRMILENRYALASKQSVGQW